MEVKERKEGGKTRRWEGLGRRGRAGGGELVRETGCFMVHV